MFIGWNPLKLYVLGASSKTYSLVVSSMYMTYGPFSYYVDGVFGSVHEDRRQLPRLRRDCE